MSEFEDPYDNDYENNRRHDPSIRDELLEGFLTLGALEIARLTLAYLWKSSKINSSLRLLQGVSETLISRINGAVDQPIMFDLLGKKFIEEAPKNDSEQARWLSFTRNEYGNDLVRLFDRGNTGLEVSEVQLRWDETYRLTHRVASEFSSGYTDLFIATDFDSAERSDLPSKRDTQRLIGIAYSVFQEMEQLDHFQAPAASVINS